jgi:hypothetical protein
MTSKICGGLPRDTASFCVAAAAVSSGLEDRVEPVSVYQA